jgi:GNAT superfamily N-acetyltransferase
MVILPASTPVTLVKWKSVPDVYLDLFVDKTLRGKGHGRKLIMATHQAAKDKGCGRLYWATKESNATARRLYDSVGELEFVQYKMSI